jgi:hypothetical protein
MADLGANLKKPTFELDKLPKFEKNFYHEATSVSRRSEREINEFRTAKEVRVSGKHIPRPVETFEEAGFPCTSPSLASFLLDNKLILFSSLCFTRDSISRIPDSHRHSIPRMAHGPIWS